jgi:flagellar biosynthesis GTPase FlhF
LSKHWLVTTSGFARHPRCQFEKREMRKVLAETERACNGLLEAITNAKKEKRARVEVSEFTVLLAESRRLQRLLEEAVNEQQEEAVAVKEREKKVAKKDTERPQRVKKASAKQQEAEQEDEEEEDEEEASKPQRKRRQVEKDKEEEVEEEEAEVNVPGVKRAKGKVKSGGVVLGPGNELVFYASKRGGHGAECPVFGKDHDEYFQAKTLVPCDVGSLEEAQLDWACRLLFEVFADQVRQAVQDDKKTALQACARAYMALHDQPGGARVFLNEHASKKGLHPEVLSVVRDLRQVMVSAGVFRDAVYCLMTAKLHEELKEAVGHGDFTVQFRRELAEMCKAYEIEVKASTLERYLPAGKLMQKCKALAFVGMSQLLQQQVLTKRMIENEEMVRELSNLASGGLKMLDATLGQEMVPVVADSMAAVVAGLMKSLCAPGEANELEVTRVNASLSAFDFARVMRMNFGNGPVGCVTPSIVWEYASLVNTSLVAAGIGGWCLTENFFMERVPPKLDWIAVACYEASVGIVLNIVEKQIVAHAYIPMDEESVQELAHGLLGRLKLPENFGFKFVVVSGYEDAGLLHWLSRVVWAKGVGVNHPVELVRLQCAMEMFKQDLVPCEVSLLDLIAKDQQPPLVMKVEQGKSLNEDAIASLSKSGFFVIRGFLSRDLCGEGVIAELSRRVLQCKKRETVFQGSVYNDNRRLQASVDHMEEECAFSGELQALLDAVSKNLKALVPSRTPSTMMGLLSLDECGPQRPHADYTRESLEKIKDDGFSGGAPLGVVIGLQPNTVFDMWPGAINWDGSRFYEHKQLKLGPGDAVFFLGNAVHAGSAFEKENVRLHCYLDSPDVQREPNTTCFMDVAAGVGNILSRGVKLPARK